MAADPKPTAEPIFLGWGKPLAKAVAAKILEDRTQRKGAADGVVDLGGHIVIVPAPMAGRLIEEEMAALLPQGLLVPRFVTPTDFLGRLVVDTEDKVPAREADALLAWIEVLRSDIRAQCQTLFPVDFTTPMSHADAHRMARSLMQIRDDIGSAPDGYSFKEVAAHKENPEPGRWADLARLETAYEAVLNDRVLVDHNNRRRQAARTGKAPSGTTHIWLACVADPQPLVITALARLAAEGIHVQALVGADKEPGMFDAWGRPSAEAWSQRELDWPEFNEVVHVTPNPLGGLDLVRALLRNQKPTPGTVALCACDRETDSPKLAALVGALGSEAIDPLGRLHSTSGLHHALRAWAGCLRKAEPTFAELRVAFHVPEIVTGLAGGDPDGGYEVVNERLDEADGQMTSGPLGELIARSKEKPDGTARDKEVDAREALAALRGPLTLIAKSRAAHLGARHVDALKSAMAALVGKRMLNLEKTEDAFLFDVLEDLEEAADALAAADAGPGKLSHAEFIELALELTGSSRFRQGGGTSAVNLPGWLEATWDPVPHLILFGFNDHLIPRSKHADPFLPGSLRRKLGLPSNEDAFAAAAYALEQMRRQRLAGGRLDIIVSQADANGEPMRPSRLLFLGPVDKLHERVKLLFGDSEQTRNEPYWEIPPEHRLDPRAPAKRLEKLGQTLSASSMKTYLDDPAKYWMSKALDMGESSFGQVELGNAGFGTLVHGALERWGRTHIQKAVKGADSDSIAEDMVRCLREHVLARFGATLPPVMRLQVDIAARRLRAFAPRQVALWDEGWVIEAVEAPLPKACKIGETPITGYADRIDRNGDLWRVYDYKTFASAKPPEGEHLRTAQVTQEGKPEDFLNADRTKRWIDVQMPLYKWMIGEHWPEVAGEDKVEVGYICLPAQIRGTKNADEDTHLRIWANLDDEMKSAKATMKEVEKRIRERKPGSFLPSEQGEYPLIASMAARPMAEWLDIDGLGRARA